MNTFRSPDAFGHIRLFAQMHGQIKHGFFFVLHGKSRTFQDFRSRQAVTNNRDCPSIYKALLLCITETAAMMSESLFNKLFIISKKNPTKDDYLFIK